MVKSPLNYHYLPVRELQELYHFRMALKNVPDKLPQGLEDNTVGVL